MALAVAGFLARWLLEIWLERHSEVRAGVGVLLKSLAEGKLGKHGKERLRSEALLARTELTSEFSAPSNSRRADRSFGEKTVLPMDLRRNACPQLVKDGAPTVFLDLAPGDIPERIQESLQRLWRDTSEGGLDVRWKLLSLLNQFQDHMPVFWITAPHAVIRNRGDLDHAMRQSFEAVRSRAPGARVVLEVFLSDDVKNSERTRASTGVSGAVGEITDPPEHAPAGAIYTLNRNKASRLLASGYFFAAQAESERRPLPQLAARFEPIREILRQRIPNDIFETNSRDPSGTVVAVDGPPGSGKTQFATTIAEYLAEQGRVVVEVAGPALDVLIRTFESGTDSQVGQFDDEFLKHICPLRFKNPPLALDAFADAFRTHAKDSPSKCVFLFDDLTSRRDARSVVRSFLQADPPSGFRYVLVGRSLTDMPLGPLDQRVNRALWTPSEARALLRCWFDDADAHEIDNLFVGSWLGKQDEFSSYLLSAIYHNNRNLESTQGDLILGAVRRHVNAVQDTLPLDFKSSVGDAATQLERMRGLVENGATIDELKKALEAVTDITVEQLVEWLGILSWKGRFETQSTLDAPTVMGWLGGLLSLGQCDQLLRACGATRIMRRLGGLSGAYEWQDAFVADGTAAVYFYNVLDSRRLKSQESGTILEMIDALGDAGSVNILDSALDASLISWLISSADMPTTRLAKTISSLLTPTALSQLSGHEESAWSIAQNLCTVATKVSPDVTLAFAEPINRLYDHSEQLRNRLADDVQTSGRTQDVAVAVHCVRLRNSEEFFRWGKGHGIAAWDVLLASTEGWGPDGTETLWKWMKTVASGLGVERCALRWSRWCERHSASDSIKFASHIVDNIVNDDLDLFGAVCLRSNLHRAWPERPSELSDQLDIWLSRVSRMREGLHFFPQEILTWYGRFHGFRYDTQGVVWVLDEKNGFALPTMPQEPITWSTIVDRAWRPPRWTLPSSEELVALNMNVQDGWELVRDGLPEDFDPDKGVRDASRVKVWNGVTVRSLSREELGSAQLYWRPRLALLGVG